MAAGVVATPPRRAQSVTEQPRDDRPPSGRRPDAPGGRVAHAAGDRRAVASRAELQAAAPYTRSGRTATTRPTARPVIDRLADADQRVPAEHRRRSAADGRRGRRCRRPRTAGRRRGPRRARGPARRPRRRGRPTAGRVGSTAQHRPERRTRRRRRDDAAIRVMLVPSAVIPPSAEEQGLHDQHHASGRAPPSTGRRARRPARRRAGGRWCPRADREVEHLGGEDEGRRPGRPSGRCGRRARGARRAARRRRRPRATTPVATDVGASRKPSGTCIGIVLRWERSTLRPLVAHRPVAAQPTLSRPFATRRRHSRSDRGREPHRLSPGDTAPDFTLTDRHRRAGLAVRPARPQGDRLLLPGRDDARLHQAGLRLPRLPRLAAGAGLRGASASPPTSPRSWRSSASATR